MTERWLEAALRFIQREHSDTAQTVKDDATTTAAVRGDADMPPSLRCRGAAKIHVDVFRQPVRQIFQDLIE